jgi:predicted  nucleic acid-binding Zn-ribbon protein
MDDKALLQKYRKEIQELKEKLSNTNEAFERERQQELQHLRAEKEKFEEELHEQQLLRTALKERIDHLTRLILTSGSIAQTPVGQPSTSRQSQSLESVHATAEHPSQDHLQIEMLNNELVSKEVEISRLNALLQEQEDHRGKNESRGDRSTSPMILPQSTFSSTDSLINVNTEIVQLKQRNRELEIVAADAEERYALLVDEYEGNSAQWETEKTALTEELKQLKSQVSELRQKLRSFEITQYVALEAEERIAQIMEDHAQEIRKKNEELAKMNQKIADMNNESTLTKAELNLARLTSK